LQTSYASVSRLTCDWNTAKLENPNAYIWNRTIADLLFNHMFGPPNLMGRTMQFLNMISRFSACYSQLCSLSFHTIYPMFFAWCSVRFSHNSQVFPMFYNNRFILFGLPQSSIMLASTRGTWKFFTIGVPFWFWQGLYWHIGCNLDIWYWYGYWY
jgi:hypothetical protein